MPVPAAQRIVEVPLAGPFDDRASAIGDPEPRERLHEGVLKGRQARHDGDDGVAHGLRQPVRRSHRPRQAMRRLDDVPDHGEPFGRVAAEQRLVAPAAQREVELPDEVPGVVQPGVHSLAAERAVDVRGVAGDEHPPDAQLRRVPVMDAEVAAPVEGLRLDARGRALGQDLPHEVERGRVALRAVDRRDDAPPRGAHGKDGARDRARSGTAAARRQEGRRSSGRRPA